MVGWSSFSRTISAKIRFQPSILTQKQNVIQPNVLKTLVRCSGGHGPPLMDIVPSRFQWDKFKDLVHFYTMVGMIPCMLVATYVNFFIGPAKLAPIPEDYEPKRWEYHKHPISRFISRYITYNRQQEYEKMLHYLYEEQETAMLRRLERDIKNKMAERKDYMYWFVRPAEVKHVRVSKEAMEEIESHWGD